ncbi:hypothetical protein [Alienimonas sp. DA493]|uniref:hypothetical protein n=1 Tax=Alienimonas sp. DA493 TaxID=3373605 RepID=UPI0037549049
MATPRFVPSDDPVLVVPSFGRVCERCQEPRPPGDFAHPGGGRYVYCAACRKAQGEWQAKVRKAAVKAKAEKKRAKERRKAERRRERQQAAQRERELMAPTTDNVDQEFLRMFG